MEIKKVPTVIYLKGLYLKYRNRINAVIFSME
jgi:hypothetical protein